jgi:hypothetical protein
MGEFDIGAIGVDTSRENAESLMSIVPPVIPPLPFAVNVPTIA